MYSRLNKPGMLKLQYFVILLNLTFLVLMFFRHSWNEDQRINPRYRRLLQITTYEKMSFTSYNRNFPPVDGIPFPEEFISFLNQWKISDSQYYVDADFTSDDVVFVTYSSSNHFTEARVAIRELRNIFKNKIIFYNLGLKPAEVSELEKVCNLKVRKFNFSAYPASVRNLKEYRFKPILIAEVFLETKAFWVIDASIRFRNATKALNDFYDSVRARKVEQFVLRHPASHSIYCTTEPIMFHYLPMELQTSKKIRMLEANTMFVRQSEFAREAVKWNALCALTDDCMGPSTAKLACNFSGSDRFTISASCHRFDQSSINIIIDSLLERDGRYVDRDSSGPFGAITSIERDTVMKESLDIPCAKH